MAVDPWKCIDCLGPGRSAANGSAGAEYFGFDYVLLDLRGEHLHTGALQRAVLGEKTLPTRSKVGAASGAHLGLPNNVHKTDSPRALG